MRSPSSKLLTQALLLAFCSMIYELLLAQVMSAALGDTVLRYATTIGIFMAAMGFGSMTVRNLGKRHGTNAGAADKSDTHAIKLDATRRLIRLELLIVPVGALGPFAIVALSNFPGVVEITSYALITLIGFMTGRELPLLLALAEKGKAGAFSFVLAADYFGMFMAAILFPFLLLPKLGVFGVGFMVAAVNSLVAAHMAYDSGHTLKSPSVIGASVMAMALAILGTTSPFWTETLSRALFLRGLT